MTGLKRNYFYRRVFIGLLACLFVGSLSWAQKQTADKILAIVDDEIVLLSDVEIQYQQLKQEQDIDSSQKCVLLDQMLLQKMYLAQAVIDSIEVSDEEVDIEIERRLQYFISLFGSSEKMEAYYGKSIVELKNEFQKDVREQILSDRMQSKIFEDIRITPSEVKSFYRQIPSDSIPYFNAKVQIGQIVIYPKTSDEQRQYTIDKLEKIRAEILSGKSSFSTKAIIESEDPGSATKGGDLGYIKRGELVPEFEAMAFRLEKNIVSPIIETEYGFHILEVSDIRGEKRRVRHILISPKITQAELVEVKNEIEKLRIQLQKGLISYERAVAEYSEDEATKYSGGLLTNPTTGSSFFEADEVEGEISFIIEKMKEGTYSKALPYVSPTGKRGFRILSLRVEIPPHKANLEQDYDKVKELALAQKQIEAIQDWTKDRKSLSYIFVDSMYHSCPHIQKWLK